MQAVAAIIAVFGLALLASACGGSPSKTSAGPAQSNTALDFARCMRAHGVPNFPAPTALGSNALAPGIDPNAPQFQAAETSCERQARKALGLP